MKINANPICMTLDWLWRLVVKSGKDRCEVCGGKECLECHHIVTRGDHWLRWEPMNGILSCRSCHKRPVKVLAWLKENQPRRYQWLMEQKRKIHHCQRIDLEKIRMNLELRI